MNEDHSKAPLGERVRALEVCTGELEKRVSLIEFIGRDASKDSRINYDRIMMALGFMAMIGIEVARWKAGAP